MSIEQTDVIDAIGTEIPSGLVVLTISDHLDWNNDHLCLLQEKLNVYLSFIESGEIYSTYPSAKDQELAVSIICKYRPNPEGYDFLLKATSVLAAAGIKLFYGPTLSGYFGSDG